MLVADVMSSEESGLEADDMFVWSLTWRSDLVNNFLSELDDKRIEKKTPQALSEHTLSVNVSPRTPPNGLPTWAVKA